MSDKKLNTANLKRLMSALDENVTIKVGVLGSNDRKKTSDDQETVLTNAEVGASHEYGIGVPKRSFLRMPLTDYLPKKLKENGAFSEGAFKKIIKDGSIVPWAHRVGSDAVATVLEAFDNQGYGKWPPLDPRTMAMKEVKQILTETQQLRDSITYEVIE